jgi:hypothetical protein
MDANRGDLETIRHRLEHEDNLLNQRLSWILTSQSFLLTGYAILLNAPAALRSETYARDHHLLMALIPLSGVVTVFLLWAAIIAALLAMRDLRARARAHPGFESSHIQGRPMTRWLGIAAPTLIPAVFLVSWLVIMLH